MSEAASGTYLLDSVGTGSSVENLVHRWHSVIGDDFPLPSFSPRTRSGWHGRIRATRVHDLVISEHDTASAVRTAGGPGPGEDFVRLWIVNRGEWALGNSRSGSELTVPAGRFVLRHVGRLAQFATPPQTRAQIFVLPGAVLRPLLGERVVTGPTDTAELRLLVAHAGLVRRMLPDLGTEGIQAARNTLLELTRAVASGGFDEREPRLAPVLAQAAKELAERRLTDPDLSATMLARQLNVSLRTLQRAFAAEGQSVTTYLRNRRLDEALRALIGPQQGWSVSDIAAHWHFADASHFSRAFKRRYGQTPTDYARATKGEEHGTSAYGGWRS